MPELLASPVVLTVAIFLARVLDVSLGTCRTLLVFRGYRGAAAVLGFLEALVWVLAAGRVLQDLGQWYLVVAFAGGYAMGNVVGMWLEARLAIGTTLVRAVSRRSDVDLAEGLRAKGYEVTEVDGRAADDEQVEVLLIVERRRRLRLLVEAIGAIDASALCTTSDVRTPRAVDTVRRRGSLGWPAWHRGLRK